VLELVRSQSKPTDDRGAVSTIFAIMLGAGLFMAIIGLVVDGGQILVQKQLARNAADSVAEAVAIHCAKALASVNCLTDNYNVVSLTGATIASASSTDFLNAVANPRGTSMAVTLICGHVTSTTGPGPCPPLSSSPNDCKTDLALDPQYSNWVRVYTSSDPAGINPVFENMLTSSPQAYQETACSQVYWGRANAVPIDTSANSGQLPFMFGLADVPVGAAGGTYQVLGDVSPSAAVTVTDRNGLAVTSGTRGFLEFAPSGGTASCWTLGATDCTNIALNTTKGRTGQVYPGFGYDGLLKAMRLNLNKTVLLPVVTQAGTGYTVKAFIPFKLLGFNFPTTATITATSSRSNYGTYCNFTTSGSSSYCIVGNFSSRVYGTYGQVTGLGLTSNQQVLNLGYQVVKHIQ
jgi:Putative Flp pilus-assembly TadE/G-like